MAVYQVGSSKYRIDDSVQGEELQSVLGELAARENQSGEPSSAQQQQSPYQPDTQSFSGIQEPQQAPGMLDRLKDIFTGDLRKTRATDELKSIFDGGIPEFNKLSIPKQAALTAALAITPDSAEQADIIKNFLDPIVGSVGIAQDKSGNIILNVGGQLRVVNKPGIDKQDLLQGAATGLAYVPAASGPGGIAAKELAGVALKSAATETAIQGAQSAAGGEFNPSSVAISAAAAPAAQTLSYGAGKLGSSLAGQAKRGKEAVFGTPEEAAARKLGKTVREASFGNTQAQQDLSSILQPNKQALSSAEDVGIKLPADVASDNTQIGSIAGLARSKQGSDAEKIWLQKSNELKNRADDILKNIGANPDISSVSDETLSSLKSTVDDMQSQSDSIYAALEQHIDPRMKVEMTASKRLLSRTTRELGNQKLKPAEQSLLKLTSMNPTYKALQREKADIGRALFSKNQQSQYSDIDRAELSKLYQAVSNDQETALLNAVKDDAQDFEDLFPGFGEEEMVQAAKNAFDTAKSLVKKRKDLERSITKTFGADEKGNISTALRGAISGAVRGNNKSLNKILNIVPEERHKEALMSGLFAEARTPNDMFSPTKFSNIYGKLKSNKAAYSVLKQKLNSQDIRLLDSLQIVSERMTRAENLVMKTGKANQALLGGLSGNRLVNALLNVTRRVFSAKSGGASEELIEFSRSDVNDSLARLFSSDEFTTLVRSGYNGKITERQIRPLVNSGKFKAFANKAGIPKDLNVRTNFILQAINSASQEMQETD